MQPVALMEKDVSKKTSLTIADIARLANVSKSTVSRALNDSPLISAETKDRIHQIARSHQFQLNAPARQLSLRQSRTVAFVTHGCHAEFSVEDLFVLEIMGGISSELTASDYDLLVVHVDPRDTAWAHQYLDTRRVDGFILMTTSRKKNHIHALLEADAPFIVWGVPLPERNYPSITGDNLSGGRLAAQRLLELGRTRIAFLGGPQNELEVQQRYEGYSRALRAAGIGVNDSLAVYGDYSQATAAALMEKLLSSTPGIDGLFAGSDLMAIAAMQVIRAHGKRIPEDIAVVGYDDLSIAAMANPPLTTIRQNIPQAGRLLARNLIEYLRTGLVSNTTLPVELVVRQSA